MIRAAHDPISLALQPWTRRLVLESVARWLVRGAIAGALLASAILGIGWLTPIPEPRLHPYAFEAALVALVLGAAIAVWPASTLRRASQLDVRLGLSDRLTTAWLQRSAQHAMAHLQRADTLARLGARSPERDLPLRWQPVDVGVLIACAVIAAFLTLARSPMQSVLDQQAAEATAVQQASERVDALRQDVAGNASLTPEQARQLDELLRQAHADLATAKSAQDAQNVLASTAQQLAQLGDPSAGAQEEALGAMSETLTQEPLTRALGDALGRNDPAATAQAAQALAAQADELSDIQRQALSRALQRAANVGRGEPRSAGALRAAAQALNDGTPANALLDNSAQALQQALQSVTAQAALRSTGQRLQDLRAALGAGERLDQDTASLMTSSSPSSGGAGLATEPGRTVPIDASGASPSDAGAQQTGGGVDAAALGNQAPSPSNATASENVFVPGTPSDGAYDQDLVQQPFTVRGAPRPYREVLNQYARAGRDYVDRVDVAPNVRDLVKQYFSKLEEGE